MYVIWYNMLCYYFLKCLAIALQQNFILESIFQFLSEVLEEKTIASKTQLAQNFFVIKMCSPTIEKKKQLAVMLKLEKL